MARAPLTAPEANTKHVSYFAEQLDAIRHEQREQRKLLEQLLAAVSTRAHDAAADDHRFLVAIAGAVQGRVFSARELVNHAVLDVELRTILHGATAKRVGKRLHRLADQHVGGLTLRRVDRDRDGTIWTVQVTDLHANAGAHADHGV